MSQTTLNVRMDEQVKKAFDEFCAEVGLTASAAVNIFARAVLREKRIPFDITTEADPFYSPSNMVHLQNSISQMNSGNIVEKTMEELEAMENA